MQDPNVAFQLRVRLYTKAHDPHLITITVWDNLPADSRGAFRLTCEVKHGPRVIFPRGQLVCTLAPGWATDGIAAREHIMALVGMAPDAGGGEGEDYYDDYTPEQVAWANEHWEALGCAREARYCDENGNVRGTRGRRAGARAAAATRHDSMGDQP